MNSKDFKLQFHKWDVVILALIAMILTGAFFLKACLNSKEGTVVCIQSCREEKQYYPLNVDRELTIESEYGWNLIIIQDGQVFVSDANCKGQDCVHCMPISKAGELIVCAPHQLMITILSDEGEIDSYAY